MHNLGIVQCAFIWNFEEHNKITPGISWIYCVWLLTKFLVHRLSIMWIGVFCNNSIIFALFQVATRKAYGTGLIKIGNSNNRVVSLDCDTKNSTFADDFRKVHPNQFIECFIAEQNMVGVAIGCACRDRSVVFGSTFACFLSRAYDQIRMGAISQTNANFCGSHAGVSIGKCSWLSIKKK